MGRRRNSEFLGLSLAATELARRSASGVKAVLPRYLVRSWGVKPAQRKPPARSPLFIRTLAARRRRSGAVSLTQEAMGRRPATFGVTPRVAALRKTASVRFLRLVASLPSSRDANCSRSSGFTARILGGPPTACPSRRNVHLHSQTVRRTFRRYHQASTASAYHQVDAASARTGTRQDAPARVNTPQHLSSAPRTDCRANDIRVAVQLQAGVQVAGEVGDVDLVELA